ncbi:MAG: hypothetical protein ACRCZB_03030 [Bacteroidales bacterium]
MSQIRFTFESIDMMQKTDSVNERFPNLDCKYFVLGLNTCSSLYPAKLNNLIAASASSSSTVPDIVSS